MRSVTWVNQTSNSSNQNITKRWPLQHQFTAPATSSKSYYSDSLQRNDRKKAHQSTSQSVNSFTPDTYHAIGSEESFSNLSLHRALSQTTVGNTHAPLAAYSHTTKDAGKHLHKRESSLPRSTTYPKGRTATDAPHKGIVRQSYSSQFQPLSSHEFSFADGVEDESTFFQDDPLYPNIHENKVALMAYEADEQRNAEQQHRQSLRLPLSLGKSDSMDNESSFTPTGGDLTSRLVQAIESLRMSVHDNTHAHSKTPRRAKVRRGTTTQLTFKSGGAQNKNDDNVRVRCEKVTVEVRVVFLKIGEIDTLKEYYHADLFTQAKWKEPKLNSYSSDELSKMELDKFWSPLLYIDNILSETKEAQWLTAQRAENGDVYLVERRRIRGVFLETLELNDFPLDVQDLTVTLTTERADTEVDLVPDQREMSAINSQTFVDQQEWRLHHHVEITKRIMTQEYSSSMRSQPCISVTCRAARRPGYFYWNVFLIMFMISGLSFATFSVTPDKVEHRLRLSFTLVLTSVTFKYVITQSLPKISYLTYMDKYVLMSLGILCIVSIWHALVTLIPSLLRPGEMQYINLLAPTSNTSLYSQPQDPEWNDSTARLIDVAKTGTSFIFPKLTTVAAGGKDKPINLSPLSATPQTTADAERPKLSALWQMLYNWKNNRKTNSEGYLYDQEEEEEEGAASEMSAEELEVVKVIEKSVFTSFLAFYALVHVVFGVWLYFGASKRRREMIKKDADYKAFLARNREWQSTQASRDMNAARRRQSSVMVHSL